tara:strand:- start:368 stop:1243 length:876 start_codon:yes stop_codon:yes gene_type:complete
MTTLTTIDENNYEAMALMMGVNPNQKAKGSTLPRLRIWNQGVKNKDGKRSVEVVPAGFYRLEDPDKAMYFAETVTIRPFLQRFMYKRYNADKNDFTKTVMHENLQVDLKDTAGGFNCGKPAGYIEDFDSLSDEMKEAIKQIRRVRVILGEVEMNNPIDENGNAVEVGTMPFIWEVDNKTAFKTMGEPFNQLGRQRKLPIQHKITLDTSEQELQTGGAFFLPVPSLDLTKAVVINDEDQKRFSDFLEWIKSYNEYVISSWTDKSSQSATADEEKLMSTVSADVFIDVEDDAA